MSDDRRDDRRPERSRPGAPGARPSGGQRAVRTTGAQRPVGARTTGAQRPVRQSGGPKAAQPGRPTRAGAPVANRPTDPEAAARAAARRGRLVLVVEDDEKTRRLLGHVVKRGGYRVALAEDGRKAAGVLKKARPDLIILDLRMPRMDGFQLLELLGRFKTAASIPVVMLTASDSPIDLDRALQLGVVDYLVKPISPKALLLKVRAILG